jgi:transcriptional regulator with XRE-family HTH domain
MRLYRVQQPISSGCAMEKSTFTRDYKIFCRLLRECRQNRGITQSRLAVRLKETQSEISKFERGERRLDLVQLHRWCQAVGLPLTEFVGRYEKEVSSRRK